MANLSAYLYFDGNCQEAITFYKEALGAELMIKTFADTPIANDVPKEKINYVMHSVLKRKDFVFMAADTLLPEELVQGNSPALFLVCNSKEEINTLFSKLSEGGKVIHPLEEVFFGIYGSLIDKFGVKWMFSKYIENQS